MDKNIYDSKYHQPVCNPLPISSLSKELKRNKVVQLGELVNVYGDINCVIVKVKGVKPYRIINIKTFEEVYAYEDMETLRANCYPINKGETFLILR